MNNDTAKLIAHELGNSASAEECSPVSRGCGSDGSAASPRRHTSGPWCWDGNPANVDPYFRSQAAPWLIGGDGETAVLSGSIIARAEADATLIASAPTLLQQRDELLSALKTLAPILDNDGPLAQVYADVKPMVENAIALAEGRAES